MRFIVKYALAAFPTSLMFSCSLLFFNMLHTSMQTLYINRQSVDLEYRRCVWHTALTVYCKCVVYVFVYKRHSTYSLLKPAFLRIELNLKLKIFIKICAKLHFIGNKMLVIDGSVMEGVIHTLYFTSCHFYERFTVILGWSNPPNCNCFECID